MKFDNLSFSSTLSQQRIQQAQSLFGPVIVRKIISWVLFLLGARKPHICKTTDINPGTFRSLLYQLNTQGLGVFEDRRKKTSCFKPVLSPSHLKVTISSEENLIKIKFGDGNCNLHVPSNNPLQLKVVLLTMLHDRLLPCSQVAAILQLSEDRTAKLARALARDGINAVVDQRQGQKTDYRFTPKIKGELILQFILDLIQDGYTNAITLSRGLEKRCHYMLSPRSILNHINKLGLLDIKKSLQENLEKLKKN